ncbi:MAG: hypothetical protein ACYS3S_12095, partial [Planctomycetota bacterium]
MSEIPNIENNNSGRELFRFICFWILVCIIVVLMYILGIAPTKKGKLVDTDCYMRLVRVSDLYNTGEWYDAVIPRSNAPYGERSHWTRPFDVLLLAGALPATLFTDFKSALFWWGVIISPLLMVAAIVALQWSTRPVLKEDGPFLAAFIFASQVIVLAYCQAGRPDHHSLLILVFVLSIGLVLRMILQPFNAFLCYAAGAIGAFSVWVSIESMLSICMIIATLGFLWLLKDSDFLQKSLHYSIALFIFTSFSLILERSWHDLTTQQFDRISIVHLGVLGFVTVFWIICLLFDRYKRVFHQPSRRFSFVIAGGAAIALMTLFCFPKFYKGPLADIDPGIIPIWLSRVNEVRSLFSKSGPLVIPTQLISMVILSLPILVYFTLWKRNNEKKDGWIFILFTAIVFFLISLFQIRWSVYTKTLLVIPVTALMVSLRRVGPKTGFLKTLKNVFVLMFFCAAPFSLGLLADRIIKSGDSAESRREISMIQLCGYLNEEGQRRERILRILAHVDFGPEILYRTKHEVIGTPYHRNSRGIVDTYDIMTADTDEKALGIIQKRDVDLILLCPKLKEPSAYSKSEQVSTFYQRLCENKVPNWLK